MSLRSLQQLTRADAIRIEELAVAVLAENHNLEFKTLTIRENLRRKPKTRTVTGVRFGHSGLNGYIVPTEDGPPHYAVDIQFPKAHHGLQLEFTVVQFLVWMTEDVQPASVSSVIDKLAWQIERLLPDGHKDKRVTHPDD